MSGEDDSKVSSPAKNPFVDDGTASSPRAKKSRAPGIISAGGVDMARAHARDIRVRETRPEPVLEERVILTVETNPRRIQTQRRLLDTPPSLEAAGHAFPAHESTTTPESTSRGPVQGRVVRYGIGLLVGVGLAVLTTLIVQDHSRHDPEPSEDAMGIPTPPPPLSKAPPPSSEPPESKAPIPDKGPSAPLTTSPIATTARRMPKAAPPRKPPFAPPFELPDEKHR